MPFMAVSCDDDDLDDAVDNVKDAANKIDD